ncbi:MAG: phage minor capsid protein [Oenococcus sp.]|uniref:phage minor capsid protein n=1 Tax=Oenococcus sp. TaxID=1979414 RepID=UPI0039E938C3
MAKIPLQQPNISPNQLKKQAEAVSNLYSSLSDAVFENFLKHLTSDDLSKFDQSNILLWKIKKLSESKQINNENLKLIVQYAGITSHQLHKLIVQNGQKTYLDALKAMPKDYQKTSRVLDQLQAVLTQTQGQIDNLTRQTLLDTNLASGSLSETAFGQYRSVVNEAAANVATGKSSLAQAIENTVSKWIDTGTVGYLTDKGGKQWTLDNFARTTLTSTAFSTYNQMREQPAVDNGIHLFWMSEHAAPREACEPIQGGVVYDPRTGEMTDEEADYGAPDLSDYGLGDPGGTMGINCHHYLTPFVVGVNIEPGAEDEAESEEQELNSDDDDYGDDN